MSTERMTESNKPLVNEPSMQETVGAYEFLDGSCPILSYILEHT